MRKTKGTLDSSTLLANLRKSTGSITLNESEFSKPKEFYSTGCYALNRIISGSFFGGIPEGRLTILYGESASAKSYIAASTAAQAIKDNKINVCFLLDSEGGVSKDMFDMFEDNVSSNIEHILVESVEDCSGKISNILTTIKKIQENDPEFKAMIILDSIGALISSSMLQKIDDNNQVSDMGTKAKLINTMIKSINIPALKTGTSVIINNHIYDDPNARFPSKIKTQSGGRGLIYMSRMMIQCQRSLNNNTDKQSAEICLGTTIKFICTKNMLIQPFHSCQVEIDFSKGFVSPYTGLLDLALKYGFVKEHSTQSFVVPSWNDKPFKKALLFNGPDSDKIWNSFINVLDEVQNNDIKYGALLSENENLEAVDLDEDSSN